MKKKILLLSAAIGLIVSCNNQETAQEEVKEVTNEENTQRAYVDDPHSYALANEAVVTHLDWKADVNFDTKVISAEANWIIKTSDDAEKLILDTYGLSIKEVTVDGETVEFGLGEFEEELGQSLTIPVTPESKLVTIKYETTDEAKALQWLDAGQTAGKTHPFLFTQSQAILARTWIPCQDSPGIRYTYKAEVQVPKDMIALMSASNPMEKNETGLYNFEMRQPIPSYLMALASGDVVFSPVSKRTGVYAEPSLIDTSVFEFADLETMVVAAENLYGPYAWDRYDIIVLPPSFPFGGMENPRLTFATPTILAGDRSLVSLVAHELAHSWSGNLVTNSTWDDFWLNEGFTVYFEHRIMEEVYGREYSEMLSSLTRDELLHAADDMMKTVPEDTKLKLNLKGRNPDDGVTHIPYNKGYFLLRSIEEEVGREKFDGFLKNYFSTFQFQVMDTERFLEYLEAELLADGEAEKLRIKEWVYETGIPDNIPVVESDKFAIVDAELKKFLDEGSLPSKEITDKWTTHEWLHFINHLPREMNNAQLAQLDEAYGFTKTGNSEIAAAWFQPTIRSGYATVYPRVESFLISVGRRKFLTPTYRALKESGKLEMAKSIYSKARPNYHAVSRETMDDLLLVDEEA